MPRKEFWKQKTLQEMNREEWEALCDGCAYCCLHKIYYEDTKETEYTSTPCSLLDLSTCQCISYKDRHHFVPECAVLTPETVQEFTWLPETCSYRLLGQGKPLPEWHPLITGSKQSTHQAHKSIMNVIFPEENNE